MIKYNLLLLSLVISLPGCKYNDPNSIEYLASKADLIAIVKISESNELDLKPLKAIAVKIIKGTEKPGDKLTILREPLSKSGTITTGPFQKGEHLVFLKLVEGEYIPITENAVAHVAGETVFPAWRKETQVPDKWHGYIDLKDVLAEIEAVTSKAKKD